eukprot:TRINITY_DN80490_c0_g1_i1.p1 TRINITY_DN80490_c0_g1~~TRINITY_DN80490_c0_g1_i1.p1  ORF type:complete len:622 (+),score=126.85 TRINITY_DN80490_c0_g1_i1:188-2053(+)
MESMSSSAAAASSTSRRRKSSRKPRKTQPTAATKPIRIPQQHDPPPPQSYAYSSAQYNQVTIDITGDDVEMDYKYSHQTNPPPSSFSAGSGPSSQVPVYMQMDNNNVSSNSRPTGIQFSSYGEKPDLFAFGNSSGSSGSYYDSASSTSDFYLSNSNSVPLQPSMCPLSSSVPQPSSKYPSMNNPPPPLANSANSQFASVLPNTANWNLPCSSLQCTVGRYILNKRIGQGSYGVVWEAFDGYTGQQVAIKAVSINSDAFRAKRLAREIRILRHLRNHPNIVSLIDVLVGENGNTTYLVFEYATTDLYRLQCSSIFLTEEEVARAMFQLLTGVASIHRCGVIHRDLKPANILISSDGFLKICDFGLARGLGLHNPCEFPLDGLPSSSLNVHTPLSPISRSPQTRHRRQLTMHVVTRWYRPPEVILLAEQYDCAVDMWSLGCIMADLLSMVKENVSDPLQRRPIFPGNTCYPLTAEDGKDWENNYDQLNVIFNVLGTPNEDDIDAMNHEKAEAYLRSLAQKTPQDLRLLYKSASKQALDFLKLLLEFNPKKRLTAEEALDHPFLKEVRAQWSHLTNIGIGLKPIRFEFEDYEMTIEELKGVIVDESKHFQVQGFYYHPNFPSYA